MKNVVYLFIIGLVSVATLQAQHRPHRTAEDIARKQTEMLVRELNIHDSVIRDTLYRMHLKFARKREISNTRAEAMQYMQEANAELQQILTFEQYQQFMNEQVNYSPHHPKPHYNRITIAPSDTTPPPGVPDMPPPLPQSRL